MKDFKQFIQESVTIQGDFNGTLNIGGESPQPQKVGEEFSADIVYQGSIHRLTMVTETGIPTETELAEYLQDEYPGSMVHQIYTQERKESPIEIKNSKRYHPAKLDWV
jgi:hypothetical protein